MKGEPMCNPTSAPPRRDLYQLETELRTHKGPFLLPKPKPPRIGQTAWMAYAERRTAVFNANYAANGDRLLDLDKPWTVLTPDDFRAFKTHAEAIAYAFKETA